MGAVAGRALCETSDVVISFLDDWSIATTGTDATDIANLVDADCELANPQIVYWLHTPGTRKVIMEHMHIIEHGWGVDVHL